LQQKIARLAMGIKKVLPDDVIELKQRVQDLVFLIKRDWEAVASRSERHSSLHLAALVLTSVTI
jgi:hypothetical protein